LDDPEKIKSITGITRVWIEEASEFTESDINQLNLRLRGAEDQQITLTFNPIDEQHFLKKRFFDFEDEDVTVFHSTYIENKFLPNAYVKELLKYKRLDYNYYRVYALGEWGKLDSGAECYRAFDVESNTIKKAYDPSLPLHLSFDENVRPYLTVTVWQGEGASVWQIDEVCLVPPKNTLLRTCEEIKNRYANHEAGVFIYGDATSQKDDTKIEKGYNFFKLARKYLKQFNPRLKVSKSNPPVMPRITFLNQIFAGMIEGVEVKIGRDCENTVTDFKYVKEASDGTKLKEKKKDEKTGVPYEPYGHCTDTTEYFICEYFAKDFAKFRRGERSKPNYLAQKRKLRTQF
jgi:PBSX family phage terminase large subunit